MIKPKPLCEHGHTDRLSLCNECEAASMEADPVNAEDDLVEVAVAQVNDRFPNWRPTPTMTGYARAVARAALEVVRSTRDGEIERLRAHIAEQVTHAETRIKDGVELGATVWRIALEDIVRENRQALNQGTPNVG